MPVLIRGLFSGGGKIRDADALPEDVRSGKVFYNNDGKQVGVFDGNIFEAVIPWGTTNTQTKTSRYSYKIQITNDNNEYDSLISGKETVLGGTTASGSSGWYYVAQKCDIPLEKLRYLKIIANKSKYQSSELVYTLKLPNEAIDGHMILRMYNSFNDSNHPLYFFIDILGKKITKLGFSTYTSETMQGGKIIAYY